jgi:hypothetical protein
VKLYELFPNGTAKRGADIGNRQKRKQLTEMRNSVSLADYVSLAEVPVAFLLISQYIATKILKNEYHPNSISE